MGYTIQNVETGELDYIHCDHTTVQRQDFDEETGEPLNDTKLKVRYAKTNSFHIPRKYLRGTPCEEIFNEMAEQYKDRVLPSVVPAKAQEPVKPKSHRYTRDYFINEEGVNNEIILGYNKSNITLFLVPSFFCFNIYLAFVLSLVELFLHYWAHRRNDLNMNKEVFFRSPLHVLTSQFCAKCRSESEIDRRVFCMLNKQLREARLGILKDVSKVIG